ncbi:TonB-linked SusC/RagA family outer membrane protein [Dysgonomonas hofstadii]|uniref:TonB-linked SusC/RagA family outer membrane protein n=1 Tax=Dysgonomonas hofstadii TaxID=637886 RepID=A0A840CSC3_9BACT|nr:TonB-dependent receptor [Dysgonomonas hofstadii]MBB4037038.1 TonB-linked SusC/RagA family outer membrane protein [Dysgonomonas hofstadii]
MKSFKYYKEKKPLLTINLKIFTFFIAFLIFTGVHAREYQATYSFDIKNESITKVIEKIQKETGYIFFYYNGVIDPDLKINLKTNNLSLSQTLDRLFASTNNGYRLSGRQIFVFRKNEEKGNSIAPQQQTRKVTVKGTVTDDSGLSVIGASIVEKGTTNGTVTNIDGQFTLGNVAPGATVTISYIGFTTQTIIAKENETYNIRLKEDPKTMDEIVVIGYGTQRRSLVTSAISKLTIDESTTRQVASPSQLLNGRIAGVTTFTGSGNVGSGERMSVRGMASISAGNEPLYVIDGVPITNDSGNLFNFGETMSSLATLNTSDIESIEVLKDAASAAIYGSRATNGVIVITTKSGKEGRSDVQVNVSTGFSKFPNIGKIKLADSELYIKDYNAGIDNYNKQYGYSVGSSGYKTHISNPFGDLPDTDWMDLITQTGTMFNMDASFSGGTKKTKYYIGANYNTTEGIIVNNKMNKVNLKAKVSHEFTPWLEVGTNNSANYTKNFQVPGAELGSTVIGRAIEQRPFDRPYKPNGDYYVGGTDELTRHNIVQIMNEQDVYLENFRFLGNYYAMLKYKDKLSWKYSFSADVNYTYDYTYYNENHPYGMGNGRLIDQNRLIKNFISENVINYNDKFKDFSLSATLGHSFQKVTNRNAQVDGRGFPSPSFNVNSVASEILGSTSMGVYAMESYFGRATLSYLDRYILTGTLRGDGSSKFAKDQRWGWFPSLSLGWNISNEKFMEGRDAEIKFRASYGKTGNQGGIGRYDYQALMMGGYNYRGNSGIAVSSFGNSELTWETADQYDIGFDVTLLKGKVNIMLDAYQKNTKDLLYSMPIQATSGVTSIMSNIGSMRNRGLEFTINTHFTFGKFEWLSQFNIATNKNKITSLIDETTPISIGSNRALKVGEEMGAYYIFEMEGIYQYDGEIPKEQYDIGIRAGDVKWKDVDGNGIINDNDRVMMGSSNPDFYGGWNNTFRYKGLQLDVFFTYMYGNDVYAQWMTTVARAGYRMAKLKEYAENAWTGPGSTNTYSRSMEGDVNNNRNSDRWLKDGSFIRLRTLTLGYNLPKKIIEPIGLKGLRVYCQADNLFLLTKYPGWDPEISNNLDPRFVGVDNWNVPQPRTFMIGANISF